MSNYVKIAVIGMPTEVVPEESYDKDDLAYMEAALGRYVDYVLPYKPDLIVFPEVCDLPYHVLEGLDHRANYIRRRGDLFLDFFKKVAKENNCYIAYNSWVYKEDGTLRNGTRMIGRSGELVGMYEKNHLTFGEFDLGILPGADAAAIECDFGTVSAATCFDLNFDEIRERCHAKRPKLVLFCSQYDGELMRNVFAHETRAYFAGCCPGYYLSSAILSPLGEELANNLRKFPPAVVRTLNLDYAVVHRDENEEKLRAVKAKYGSAVTVRMRDDLGACLVASESPDRTAEDILAEFGIEEIDAYLESLETNIERTPLFED